MSCPKAAIRRWHEADVQAGHPDGLILGHNGHWDVSPPMAAMCWSAVVALKFWSNDRLGLQATATFAETRARSSCIDIVENAPSAMWLVDGPGCAERSRCPIWTYTVVVVDPVFRQIDLAINDPHRFRIIAELVL